MKVKICGLSTPEQVKASISYGANFCGFILNYPKSHRFIQFEKAKELTNIEKKNTKYVAVLVNPKDKELEKFSKLNIDYFQIYGNYNSESISNIKSKFNFENFSNSLCLGSTKTPTYFVPLLLIFVNSFTFSK